MTRRSSHRVDGPARGFAALLFVGLLVATGFPGTVASDPPGEPGWDRDLATLEPPYSAAQGVTAMVLSEDAWTLVIGTDNGGVLFLNATTGAVLEAWETSSHGAVVDIRLDQSGTLAAVVYQDAYVAVVSLASETPLLTKEPEGKDQPRPTAALSPNGRFLVVAHPDGIELYHRDAPASAPFTRIDSDTQGSGPFVWFHKQFLFFGALAPDGEVTLYSYNAEGLMPQGTRDITDSAGTITALAVSGNGNRFAVALDTGDVIRYTPSLNPAAPQLIPGYKGNIQGAPRGIALNMDGMRLTAWSARELLWIDGCNQNVDALCGGKTTEKDTVRLRPPIGTDFGGAAVTPDLSRAVVHIEGETRERRLYNLPTLDHFVMKGEAGGPGRSLLDPTGETIFIAEQASVQAEYVSPAELPPSSGVQITGGGGDGADGEGFSLFGLGTDVLLFGGIGILALLLLVVLVSVGLAMRRGTVPRQRGRPLPSLAPLDEIPALARPPPSGGATMPGRVKPVTPSAPSAAPPPDGLMILQGVTAGPPFTSPLDLAVRRAEVLRVVGPRPAQDAFVALLEGHSGFRGLLAIGGASATETPVLFRRRLRLGLGAEPAGNEDAATLFRRAAEAHGLPVGLVERRMQKDLGWMGERLGQAFMRLRPLDRWKVRIALALVDRPHVLALRVQELPFEGAGAERTHTLRLILSGIARHYDTLVVVLDDGSVPTDEVRVLADEEVTLDAQGFRDRRLLSDGRPVATNGHADDLPRKPRRAQRG